MRPNKIDAVGYATARNTFEAAVDNRAFGRARNTLEAAFIDNRIDGRGTGVKKFIATGIDGRVGDRASSEDVLIAAVDRRPDACVADIEDAALVENREEGLTAAVDIFDAVFVDDCAGGYAAAEDI